MEKTRKRSNSKQDQQQQQQQKKTRQTKKQQLEKQQPKITQFLRRSPRIKTEMNQENLNQKPKRKASTSSNETIKPRKNVKNDEKPKINKQPQQQQEEEKVDEKSQFDKIKERFNDVENLESQLVDYQSNDDKINLIIKEQEYGEQEETKQCDDNNIKVFQNIDYNYYSFKLFNKTLIDRFHGSTIKQFPKTKTLNDKHLMKFIKKLIHFEEEEEEEKEKLLWKKIENLKYLIKMFEKQAKMDLILINGQYVNDVNVLLKYCQLFSLANSGIFNNNNDPEPKQQQQQSVSYFIYTLLIQHICIDLINKKQQQNIVFNLINSSFNINDKIPSNESIQLLLLSIMIIGFMELMSNDHHHFNNDNKLLFIIVKCSLFMINIIMKPEQSNNNQLLLLMNEEIYSNVLFLLYQFILNLSTTTTTATNKKLSNFYYYYYHIIKEDLRKCFQKLFFNIFEENIIKNTTKTTSKQQRLIFESFFHKIYKCHLINQQEFDEILFKNFKDNNNDNNNNNINQSILITIMDTFSIFFSCWLPNNKTQNNYPIHLFWLLFKIIIDRTSPMDQSNKKLIDKKFRLRLKFEDALQPMINIKWLTLSYLCSKRFSYFLHCFIREFGSNSYINEIQNTLHDLPNFRLNLLFFNKRKLK